MSGKRKRSVKAKARKKFQQENEATKDIRQTVEQDKLPWQEVAIPDTLEDTEGFYGLEEIDNVEVVRSSGKNVLYMPGKQNPATQRSSLVDHDTSYDGGDVDDEWSGIDSASQSPRNSSPQSLAKPRQEPILRANVQYTALTEQTEDEIDLSAWKPLDLSSQTLDGIAGLSFTTPTPIQLACIPQILAGHDVVGKASTGSGKTLAYGISILEHYIRSPTPTDNPLALILSPTRELAHQISSHLSQLHTRVPIDTPKIATVTGGLSIQKQQRQLSDATVIVGTPGRLWDVLQSLEDLSARLRNVRFLVIDEADRLLSEGHFQEVQQILDCVQRDRINEETTNETSCQTLVFSATFHRGLQRNLNRKIKQDLLNNQQSIEYLLHKLSFRERRPKFIDVNPASQMVEGLKEELLECAANEKDLYLYALVLLNPSARLLVFTNSISSVRRLVHLLQNLNLRAIALHSNMVQKARLRSVERFSAQQGAILIATDVAARGLDIKDIDVIVHYHVPRSADMYIHRSGRTARADRAGKSILICSPDEAGGVARLIAKVYPSSDDRLVPTEINRDLVGRFKSRITLSSKLTDASLETEKANSRDQWIRQAAEELGIDPEDDDFAGDGRRNHTQKSKRRLITKDECASLRAQLRDLLSKPVNVGLSERYIAGGNTDINKILQSYKDSAFLGQVDGLDFGGGK